MEYNDTYVDVVKIGRIDYSRLTRFYGTIPNHILSLQTISLGEGWTWHLKTIDFETIEIMSEK